MRIVVFGASGRAGLYIVKEALEREHRVAAFTRRPEAFPLGHPKLDIIGGDVLDPAAVARAVRGAHGVICALGARRRRDTTVLSKGTENIIRGMEAAGCRRLVCLSSAGILSRGARLFFGRGISRIFERRASAVKKEQLGRLLASGLDWVLVGTPRFREGPGSGRAQVTCDGPAGRYVFLGDLAAFLVEELEKGRYLKKLPTISSA